MLEKLFNIIIFYVLPIIAIIIILFVMWVLSHPLPDWNGLTGEEYKKYKEKKCK